MDASTQVKRSPNVYDRRFGDEVILLHFGRGEYFGLDAVGAQIWAGCTSGKPLGECARALERSFAVTYEQALADTLALIAELKQEDLLVIC